MTPTINPSLILFDWSGTISDDRALVYETNMRLRERHGEPRISITEWASGGHNSNASLYLSDKLGLPITSLYEEYSRIFGQVMATSAPAQMYPSAKALLARLAEQGKAVQIISSHPQTNLEAEITQYGLADLVGEAIGSVSDKVPVIRSAYESLDIKASHAAYVGDMVRDIQEAKQAGVVTIAITHGYHSKELLAPENPDLIVASLAELLGVIA